jgi:hypothetical protein
MKFLIKSPEVEILVGITKRTIKDDKVVSDFIKKKKELAKKNTKTKK